MPLGVEGLGDGQDKLVTIDVNPKSKSYGKVLHYISVSERGEAHHMGFSDDRRYLWAGGLDSNRIYIFDVAADPAKPKLIKTIANLGEKSGYLGPHTFYALPGRMLIGTLSNTKDKGGLTGLALYNNKGDFIAKYDLPTNNGGDGYGYGSYGQSYGRGAMADIPAITTTIGAAMVRTAGGTITGAKGT